MKPLLFALTLSLPPALVLADDLDPLAPLAPLGALPETGAQSSPLPTLPQMTDPARDPGAVALPAALALRLKADPAAVLASFGAAFDRLAPEGEIAVVNPGTTREIRAAADRARVFLAWTQYDLDGNGAVARREFDRHAEDSWGEMLGPDEAAVLDAEWAAADRDGDGAVTLTEIQALALAAHPVPVLGPLGPEGEAMLGMDLDNDGYVYWQEIEAVLTAPR